MRRSLSVGSALSGRLGAAMAEGYVQTLVQTMRIGAKRFIYGGKETFDIRKSLLFNR